MNKIIVAVIAFLCCLQLQAQSVEVTSGSSYKQALGIKFPLGISATYKKFVTNNNSFEAVATFWKKGFRAAAFYEFNFYSFEDVPNLSWFVGPGVHAGAWREEYSKIFDNKLDIGIDGIIGFDYKFDNVPINVSVDWQPAVTVVGSAGFTPSYGGIGVRYTF